MARKPCTHCQRLWSAQSLLALGALRLAQKYGQSEEFAKSPIHNLFVRLAPNASTALKNDERRSEEETE